MLEEFLDTNSALFADDYVGLKIDVEQMAHGSDVAKQRRLDRDGGIPWIVVLDGDGQKLISSDGPGGNIGCPISEDECAFFVPTIGKTITKSSQKRIDEIGTP